MCLRGVCVCVFVLVVERDVEGECMCAHEAKRTCVCLSESVYMCVFER